MDNVVKTEKNQILWLNTVKGFACWIVFLGHFYADYSYIPLLHKLYTNIPYFNVLKNGTFALNVFYIISAFLVAGRYLESNDERIGKSVFKRYFRLAFPIFLMDVLCFILFKFGLLYGRILEMDEINYTLWDVFRDGFYDAIFKGSRLFNPSLWMVGELFWGYCIAIMLSLIVKKMRLLNQIVFLIGITTLLLFTESDYTTFAFGVLAYIMYSLVKRRETVFKAVIGVLIIVWGVFTASYSVLIAYFFQTHFADTTLKFQWVQCWIAAMLFMTGIIFCKPARKIMDNKALAFLGKISFPVFILHRVWECSLGEKAYEYCYALNMRTTDGIKASFIVTVFATVVSALVYYFLIEPHLNKLTKLIIEAIFSEKRLKPQ